jgi:transcriptional regulator with XRE-family HTH domain
MKEIRIGTKIIEKRKEKGLTQEELADHLGISKPAVSKWESGQSYPDITLLLRLSAATGKGRDPQTLSRDGGTFRGERIRGSVH